MNELAAWTRLVCAELELDPPDRDLVLDLARDVAHGIARPAAPLTTFLAGLAAGRASGSADAQAAAVDQVRRLVDRWAVDRPTEDGTS